VHVATFDLGPTSAPQGGAHVETKDFAELIAVAYCNIHGLWKLAIVLAKELAWQRKEDLPCVRCAGRK